MKGITTPETADSAVDVGPGLVYRAPKSFVVLNIVIVFPH